MESFKSATWLRVVTICLGALVLASSLQAAPIDPLEEKIWIEQTEDFIALENQAVRKIQENPQSAYAHYLAALVYLRQFKNDPRRMDFLRKASQLGQQAIDLNENAEFGYLISASILDLMGYTDNALEMLNAGRQAKITDSWRSKFLQAQILAGKVEVSSTLKYAEQALEQAPYAQLVISPFVVAMLRSEYQGEELIEQIHSWKLKFDSPFFQQSLALAYAQNEQYQPAIELFEKVMASQNEATLDAKINRAIVAFARKEPSSLGETLLLNSLKDENLRDLEKRSLIQAHLARLYLDKGDLQTARKLFESAVTQSQNPLQWLDFARQSYTQQKQASELVSLLDQLKLSLPGVAVIHAIQGEVLSLQLGSHKQAVQAYTDALILEPKKIEYYNGLGLAYYRQSELTKALNTFVEAIRINPTDATIRYNEACILSMMGRKNEAIGSLREAINLDPRLRQLAKTDTDFTNIRQEEAFAALLKPDAHFSQLP